jgi:methylenetetrahydrofolate dehydrogenase (NADP+)/methenyltetrahydrofolate cyclohydrolase
MEARIIDGRAIAKTIKEVVRQEVHALATKDIIPRMTVLHIGKDPASISYTKSIKKISATLQIEVAIKDFEKSTDNALVIDTIESLNRDRNVHGILIQEPIPLHLDKEALLLSIDPSKDIDCMNPINLGRMLRGSSLFAPSTPLGVLKILDYERIDVEGKHVVIVGRSALVGKPLAILLLMKGKGGNATVTICHSMTKEINSFTQMADIIVVAAGKPGLLTAEMVKQGSCVIDVGINAVVDNEGKHKLVGDVDFDSLKEVTSYITPVPGGVGPVTTMMLLTNLIKAVKGEDSKQQTV